MTTEIQTQRALYQEVYGEPLVVKNLEIPKATPGSVIVRIAAAGVISYMKNIYNGKRQFPYPTPIIPGSGAVGRVAELGPDSTSLKVGDLVFIDPVIRGRDGTSDIFLFGVHSGHSDGGRKLMEGEWRHGTFAEYAKIPIENCAPIDEKLCCGSTEEGGLGYQVSDLVDLGRLLVPFGGLRDIELQPGQTVIVAQPTGGFGSAAVQVALAMGARVIAMGRNSSKLENVVRQMAPFTRPGMLETVTISGSVETDVKNLQKFRPIDAFFDISPDEAINSSHFKAAILSLRQEGRVSLMGGFRSDVPIPHSMIMHANIRLQGTWMCTRAQVREGIKLAERGLLKLSGSAPKEFALEAWDEAFEYANTTGLLTVIVP
jgi:D-arabinose 1-dehydrogenase-like Zn-dependent alcohol dehydrogenase